MRLSCLEILCIMSHLSVKVGTLLDSSFNVPVCAIRGALPVARQALLSYPASLSFSTWPLPLWLPFCLLCVRQHLRRMFPRFPGHLVSTYGPFLRLHMLRPCGELVPLFRRPDLLPVDGAALVQEGVKLSLRVLFAERRGFLPCLH